MMQRKRANMAISVLSEKYYEFGDLGVACPVSKVETVIQIAGHLDERHEDGRRP
jgi:hypothetical protein